MRFNKFSMGLLAVSVVSAAADCQATSVPETAKLRNFRGVYLSTDVGRQNVIGGSFFGGVDVLKQEGRMVTNIAVGVRGEFSSGLVWGVEFGRGMGDQDLVQNTNPVGFHVLYANNDQTHVGATLGQVFGQSRKLLAFAYVAEVTRTFDVTIEDRRGGGSSTFPIITQSDEQGLLRFGVGVERALSRYVSLRGTLGSSRADFGGKQTNIQVRKLVDAAAGVVFRIPL